MKQVSLKIAETLSAIAVESNSTKDTISFEPLHTSDYFASVGIRLSEEIKPSDKLGLQMKSFTQWLKTMKKLHTDQLRETGSTDNQLNVQNEQSIQQLAEASNKENIVVTEAMAEVLLQQGKIMKAIEVYEKLSLLDPFKKAYFAAKLKQLKG
jgi:DNA-binding SARP family transcriptional activator